LLDLLLTDDKGRPSKPWLTVILDDYSRAVAGFMIAFEAPSALHTALALRQAIWRKPEPMWQVCGIPGILSMEYVPRHIFHNMWPDVLCGQTAA
jgi:putative transposase